MIRNFFFSLAALVLGTSLTHAQSPKDIVDTAVSAGQFKTLAVALQAAGLIDTLKGPGPFTVFAPTDDAFAKLPAGTVEALLKDKQKLTAILTYHVVAGKVLAADVVKLNSAKTVQGSNVKIAVKDGKVMVNNANVVKTDIEATNGVIHVIDTVILPPTGSSAAPQPSMPQVHPASENASVVTPCSTNAVVTVVRHVRR